MTWLSVTGIAATYAPITTPRGGYGSIHRTGRIAFAGAARTTPTVVSGMAARVRTEQSTGYDACFPVVTARRTKS